MIWHNKHINTNIDTERMHIMENRDTTDPAETGRTYDSAIGRGLGFGRRRRGGHGMRGDRSFENPRWGRGNCMAYACDEKQRLTQCAEALSKRLDSIKARINELDSSGSRDVEI